MAPQPADSPDRIATAPDDARPMPTTGAPDGLAPRKRGRPAGLGRVPGSGRKKGVPNHTTADAKALILSRGKPIEFLCSVVQGQRVRVGPQAGPGAAKFEYPSLQDRMRAAMALAAKVLPDVKATELSGPDGAPIETDSTVRAIDPFDTALRLSNLLGIPLRVGDRVVHVPDVLSPAAPELTSEVLAPVSNGMSPEKEVARRIAHLLARAGHDLAGVAADFGMLPDQAAQSPSAAAQDCATQAADTEAAQRNADTPEAVSGDPVASAGMVSFPPITIMTHGAGWRIGHDYDVEPAGPDWQVTRIADGRVMAMRPTSRAGIDYARHLIATGTA